MILKALVILTAPSLYIQYVLKIRSNVIIDEKLTSNPLYIKWYIERGNFAQN